MAWYLDIYCPVEWSFQFFAYWRSGKAKSSNDREKRTSRSLEQTRWCTFCTDSAQTSFNSANEFIELIPPFITCYHRRIRWKIQDILVERIFDNKADFLMHLSATKNTVKVSRLDKTRKDVLNLWCMRTWGALRGKNTSCSRKLLHQCRHQWWNTVFNNIHS